MLQSTQIKLDMLWEWIVKTSIIFFSKHTHRDKMTCFLFSIFVLFCFFHKSLKLFLCYLLGQNNSSKIWKSTLHIFHHTQSHILIHKKGFHNNWLEKGCIICGSQLPSFYIFCYYQSQKASWFNPSYFNEVTLTRRSQDCSVLTDHRMIFPFSQRIWIKRRRWQVFPACEFLERVSY